jgi:hypothetical protein
MSDTQTTLNVARQVAVNAQGGDTTGIQTPTDANEIAQLSIMIKTWREIQKETEELTAQIKEKKKRSKVMEEMILRIMKKNNIGALDLQNSGGRLLYRRQTTKAGLGQKDMARLLAEHMKSEQAATTALQYIAEHRGTKVKESLLYEKD